MIRLQQGIDAMGNMIVAAMQQSDTIYVNVFASSTAQYVTVPSGANFVLFEASANTDFYMLLNATSNGTTIAVPTVTATEAAGAGTIPELNPLVRQLNGATSIGLIPGGPCVITLAFYS
ncbi:MAG: hypothetical protein ABSF90_03480 [Syntrophobacteraceae bacterium]|jgi:hypothetical protein